jgi:hypothetical protein
VGQGPRRDLIAKHTHDLRPRTDEYYTSLLTCLGELRILSEKPVSRMHSIYPSLTRNAHHVIDIEIGFNGCAVSTDQVAFVRLKTMHREAVLVGIDADRADA